MTDPFIVGAVRGGSLAHVIVAPLLIIWGLLAGSIVTLYLGIACGVVGGYIHWASRDWAAGG